MKGRVLGTVMSILVIALVFLFLLSDSAHAMNATFAWDSNTESDLAGYRIYYQETILLSSDSVTPIPSGRVKIDIPLSTPGFVRTSPEFSITGMDGLKKFWVAVTAFNSQTPSFESGFSNVVTVGPNLFILTTQVVGTGGTVSAGGTFAIGTIQTVTATPAQGYRVKAWTGTNDDASKTNSNTVTMTTVKTVTVSFELIPPPSAPKNLRSVTITASTGALELALAVDPQQDVYGYSVLYDGGSWIDTPYQWTTVDGKKTAIVFVGHQDMIPVNSTKTVRVKAFNDGGESPEASRTFYATDIGLNQSNNARITRYHRWW